MTADDAESAYKEYRPFVFLIAYRITGSDMEAEDIVQESFLRFHRVAKRGTSVRSDRGFLTTVATRLAIDHVRSVRSRRETYLGSRLSDEALMPTTSSDFHLVELADSVSTSFLVLLERLTPVERLVFLLREVYEYSYNEVAAIVGKSQGNCRQIFVRARKAIGAGKRRFLLIGDERQAIPASFFKAMQQGDIDGLMHLCANWGTQR